MIFELIGEFSWWLTVQRKCEFSDIPFDTKYFCRKWQWELLVNCVMENTITQMIFTFSSCMKTLKCKLIFLLQILKVCSCRDLYACLYDNFKCQNCYLTIATIEFNFLYTNGYTRYGRGYNYVCACVFGLYVFFTCVSRATRILLRGLSGNGWYLW